MKNIHVLPTEKPSRLVGNDVNQLCYQSNKSYKNDRKWMHRKKFNIYITSDEEIKEGDWVLNISNNKIFKQDNSKPDAYTLTFWKKIILTTDQDLIKDGVQAIDDEFLELFVKNPSCEKVEVEHFGTCCGNQSITQCINCKKYNPVYKIIIPQEEPKQETLEDKLQSLIVEWRKRQLHYQDVAEENISNERTHRKFNYKALATRDCWKELLTLLKK